MTPKVQQPPAEKVYFLSHCLSIVGWQWLCSRSSSLRDLADGRNCVEQCQSHGRGTEKTQWIMCWLLNLLGNDTCQLHLHRGWPKLATESLLSLIGLECKHFLVRNDPESLPESVKIHCVNLFVCLFFKKSFYLFFGPHCLAHGILIPQPGIKCIPPPVEA